jgi:hypothetical protein
LHSSFEDPSWVPIEQPLFGCFSGCRSCDATADATKCSANDRARHCAHATEDGADSRPDRSAALGSRKSADETSATFQDRGGASPREALGLGDAFVPILPKLANAAGQNSEGADPTYLAGYAGGRLRTSDAQAGTSAGPRPSFEFSAVSHVGLGAFDQPAF